MKQANGKNHYFPKYSGWLFGVLLIGMSLVYNYQSILFKVPQAVHQWRQCDCLSLTLNYYQDDNPFLEPTIHNLCADGTGRTMSDFPLIYYSVAQLWKVFGYHEYIYRAVVMILFFLGLFAMFKMVETAMKDSLFGVLVPLFLFTSPTLVYYGNNFLMDMPAFSLGMIGLFFFFRFYRTSSNLDLYLFAGFYALAGLLKIPSLLGFLAICGLYGLELINVRLKADGKIFARPKTQIVPLFLVLLIPACWYWYAHLYNSANNSGVFLIGILPIWDLDHADIIHHFDAIKEHIKWDYFRRETQLVLIGMYVFVLVRWKRANPVLLALSLILTLGFILFCILFFQPLEQHDYYTINLFILAPVITLTAAMLLRTEFPVIYHSTVFRLLVLAFLFHNVDFTRRRMKQRYSPKGFANVNYTQHLHSFRDIRPYLDKVGIKQDDRVISLSDPSINISLYLMNQKGWTNFDIRSDSTAIENKKRLGAKYIFVYYDEDMKHDDLQKFFQKKIGEFQTIRIYAL